MSQTKLTKELSDNLLPTINSITNDILVKMSKTSDIVPLENSNVVLAHFSYERLFILLEFLRFYHQ